MKLFLLLFIFALPVSKGYSLSRPDIDTVSILGLVPGLDGKLVASHVSAKIDTLLWNTDAGIGIIKFEGNYLASKGDFRIAFEKGRISQVSFVAPTHNSEENKKLYERLSQDLISIYGPPDVES